MPKKAIQDVVPSVSAGSRNEFVRYPYLDSEGRLTDKALYQLGKPFDPADLKWLPTDVKKDGDNETALALVYTDPRVYHERLDLVFGPGNWGTSVSFTTAQFFKAIPEKVDWKTKEVKSPARDVVGYKLFAVCTLMIAGLGEKTSTGEEDTSDANAATSAEAQAFKRACSMVGIGRYFYSFPRERKPYKYNKFQELPQLPAWAIPQPECSETGWPIQPFTFKNKAGNMETWDAAKVAAVSTKIFGRPLSGEVMQRLQAENKKKAEPATEAATAQESAA